MPKRRRSRTAATRLKTESDSRKPASAEPPRSPKPDSGGSTNSDSGDGSVLDFSPPPSCPVVGIGASAGGLEAFNALLKALPGDTEMAFVLIQHMDPRHESVLQNLLQKATPMPVLQVTDRMAVEPNHVYVIPPNALMAISKGMLTLTARPDRLTRNLPIDHFMASLAEDMRASAIGVILSGTGSDGTLGLKAIKAEGGVTFAQDKESAQYPSMPLSAVAANCVDFILPPDGIAGELARISRHPYLQNLEAPGTDRLPEAEADGVRRICMLLQTHTGVDLALYKQATIQHRVSRRMAIRKIESIEKYIKLLRKERSELTALYDDIFIHVTGFFRDPEVMEALERSVISRILSRHPPPDSIRVWAPGCSTGEEVYTIAMLFFEQLGERSSPARIQIFGSDISEKAIERARAGIYAESSIQDISPERQKRFFTRVEGGYQIAKPVREVCVFARHDVAKDPPFSRLDLVSCRNVLIYMTPVLQKRVIENLHYALQPDGFLLLGKSESLGAHSKLFSALDTKHKIFSRVESKAPFPTAKAIRGRQRGDRIPADAAPPPTYDVRREAERALLEEHAPAALVIDADFQVIHFQGNTSPFLAPATGEPSFHVLRLVRPELVVDLRKAIHHVKKEGAAVRKAGIRFKQNGGWKTVDVHVSPLKGRHPREHLFLVVFREAVEPAPVGARQMRRSGSETVEQARAETRLDRDLASAREQLRATVQDHEAAMEELRAMNEEVLSSNEELQSTNEELETAKEELESSNEELHTLNEELQNRNVELSQLSDDLSNLLVGVRIPIVFLDTALCIRRFTPVASEVLNLIATDIGRPFTDIAPSLSGANLSDLAAGVIAHGRALQHEVRDRNNHWYELRIQPYRTVDNKIAGVLIALLDIDSVKRSFDEAREAGDFADAIVATIREPLVVLDAAMRVVRATMHFYETFRLSQAETEGKILWELGGGQWNLPRLRELLEEILPRDSRFENFEMEYEVPSLGRRFMVLNARQIQRFHKAAPMILLAMEDITEKKLAEEVSVQGRLSAAQEGERKRIARELHDDLVQELARLAVDMGRHAAEPPTSPALFTRKFRSLQARVVRAAEAARRAAYELHPSELDDLGLEAALRSYSDEFGRHTGVAVEFTSRNLPSALRPDIVYCLYKVAQESLQNIAKHARTKRVVIALTAAADAIRLSVEDTGAGFPVESLRTTPGLGIVGMRERLGLVNGKFSITSAPGKGTCVAAEIPLQEH